MTRNVLFIHPDLGIGGAERLVVDAALALTSETTHVQIVTSHHDPDHCFQETKKNKFDVIVVGNWIPRSLFGRCMALFAYLRMCFCALYVCIFMTAVDLYFIDQISACIVILKILRPRTPVLFYCHFPDQLLTHREYFLKALYRKPLDWLEQWSTGLADTILVNSKFTSSIFRETFPSLEGKTIQVLYPTLHTNDFNNATRDEEETKYKIDSDKIVFVSINRYERKKNIRLAIDAFGELLNSDHVNVTMRNRLQLIIAGGYDSRVPENLEYYTELTSAVPTDYKSKVIFMQSLTDATKKYLLRSSNGIIYTPDREHFGIVPIEAMYCETPVIAVASGGPLESIDNNVTGYLCSPDAATFAAAMLKLLDTDRNKEMGAAGKERVEKLFGFGVFSAKLNQLVQHCMESEKMR